MSNQLLIDIQKELKAYEYAIGVISWDIQTKLNPLSIADMGASLVQISKNHTDLTLSNRMQEAIKVAKLNNPDELTLDVIKDIEKNIKKDKDVPSELLMRMRFLKASSEAAWVEAKKENDFAKFQPVLEELVDVQRQIIKYREGELKGYNILLDDYEEGLSVEDVDIFFNELKKELVPLIKKVTQSKPKHYAYMDEHYDATKQSELAYKLLDMIRFDINRGRIGETAHPFCMGLSVNDVRIATHYYENDINSGIFSMLHEGGHGLYEQGIRSDIAATILNGGTSMGIHEAMSRFYENMVGRSLPFWEYAYPTLQEIFPNFKDVPVKEFVESVNQPERSLIRIEADELTYPLHILIRYEIERMLFDENLPVSELPKVWNQKIKEYLDIDVPSDAKGVLQDTHWASGLFGYFPSYALGSANAAQIYEAMSETIDIPSLLKKGELEPIKLWLYEHVFQYGKSKNPKEIMMIATGKPSDPAAYIRYLKAKFDK